MARRRRRIAEEPVSRLALWARRIALFSLTVVLLAVIIARSGYLDIVPVLATYAAGLGLAVVGILVAFAAFVAIWRSGYRGLGQAVTAVFIGLVLIAFPAYLAISGHDLPKVADVTTDPIDPPRFEVVARLRTRTANPARYSGLKPDELQGSAYSEIVPLDLTIPPASAYKAVRAALAKRKDNLVAPFWRVIDDRPPTAGRREGHIEAIAYTSVLGFRDDVVIRIRPTPDDGARVDIRSASRYGLWDFGVNAARVRSLLEDINIRAASIKPEPPPPPPKKQRRRRQRRSR